MDEPWMVSTRGRPRPAQARPGLGEHVDGLHHSGVGGLVQAGDPVAYLVDEVDLLLRSIHPSSIADGILRWVRGPWFGPSGGELVPAPDARFGWRRHPAICADDAADGLSAQVAVTVAVNIDGDRSGTCSNPRRARLTP